MNYNSACGSGGISDKIDNLENVKSIVKTVTHNSIDEEIVGSSDDGDSL